MYGHIGFAVLGMMVITGSGIASAWLTVNPGIQAKEARS
jgi:hypothetical protein